MQQVWHKNNKLELCDRMRKRAVIPVWKDNLNILFSESLDEYYPTKLCAYKKKKKDTQEVGKNETALPPEWMKRAIKHAVIKSQIKTERTSHQVAVLYPVPRKIVGRHYKQTNHAHI